MPFSLYVIRIIRASAASGTALVPLFFIVALVRNGEGINLSPDIVSGAFISSVFLWIMGALVAFVLLIPLIPIADRISGRISVFLFLSIGFIIPAFLGYQMLHIGAHGNPPPIETEPWTKLTLTIASEGLMGSGCALASWLSVRKSAHRRKTAQSLDSQDA